MVRLRRAAFSGLACVFSLGCEGGKVKDDHGSGDAATVTGTTAESQTAEGQESSDEGLVVDNLLHCGEALPVLFTTCGNDQVNPGEFCVEPLSFELPKARPLKFSLGVLDIDTDGKTDILASGFLYKGNGYSFTYESEIAGLSRVEGLAVGDANADGDSDILYIGTKTPEEPVPVRAYFASVSFPDGYGPLLPPFPDRTDVFTRHVKIADINGDSAEDLIIVYYEHHGLEDMIYVSTQSLSAPGTFGPLEYVDIVTPADATRAQVFDVRDVDVDGDSDVLTYSHLLINDGTGTFTSRRWRDIDVIVALEVACGSTPVGIVSEVSNPTQLEKIRFDPMTGRLGVGDMYTILGAAPLNRDSAYDAVLSNDDGTYVAFGHADGTFDPPFQVSMNTNHRVGFHDVNADDTLDFILLGETTLQVFLVKN